MKNAVYARQSPLCWLYAKKTVFWVCSVTILLNSLTPELSWVLSVSPNVPQNNQKLPKPKLRNVGYLTLVASNSIFCCPVREISEEQRKRVP